MNTHMNLLITLTNAVLRCAAHSILPSVSFYLSFPGLVHSLWHSLIEQRIVRIEQINFNQSLTQIKTDPFLDQLKFCGLINRLKFLLKIDSTILYFRYDSFVYFCNASFQISFKFYFSYVGFISLSNFL